MSRLRHGLHSRSLQQLSDPWKCHIPDMPRLPRTQHPSCGICGVALFSKDLPSNWGWERFRPVSATRHRKVRGPLRNTFPPPPSSRPPRPSRLHRKSCSFFSILHRSSTSFLLQKNWGTRGFELAAGSRNPGSAATGNHGGAVVPLSATRALAVETSDKYNLQPVP